MSNGAGPVRVLFRRICLVDGLAYAARDNQAKQLLLFSLRRRGQNKKKKEKRFALARLPVGGGAAEKLRARWS